MASTQPGSCTCEKNSRRERKSNAEGYREQVYRRESAPQPLKFINFDGPPSKKSEKRKEVRSHVMFNFRWQQSFSTAPSWLSNDTNSEHTCPKCGGQTGGPSSQRREDLDSVREEVLNPRFDTAMDASRSDPFDVLPVRMSRVSKLLFDHFTHYHVLIRVPSPRNPFNNKWSAYMMEDATLINAGLVVSASHYSLITGDRELVSPAYFHHKAEAIRIINDRLSDPRLASNDITMSAVAILTISESFDGAPSAAETHMNGLEQLLNIREKWNTKDIPGLLQRLVILADQLSAKATGSPQRYQLYGAKIRRIKPSPYTPAQCFRCGATRPYDEKEMFNDLRYLTSKLQNSEKTGRSEDAAADPAFIHGLEETEQNLYCLTHEGRTADGAAVNTQSNWKVSAVAGHLYLSLFLRKVPIDSPIMQYYATNLMDALELPLPVTLSGEALSQNALFWMVLVGGTVAKEESTERKWFVKKLIEIGRGLGLREWTDARAVLKQFVWVDEEREVRGKEFWAEALKMARSG